MGRTAEVLLDAIVPPRSHEHDPEEPAEGSVARSPALAGPALAGEGSEELVHLSGRTRQNKLVHVEGTRSWLGRLVEVRIEHAGPYSLRGVPVA